MDENLVHGALTRSIIGAAMTVLNTFKPGLDERIYERSLTIELRKLGHAVEPQRRYRVFDAKKDVTILFRPAQDDWRNDGSPNRDDLRVECG